MQVNRRPWGGMEREEVEKEINLCLLSLEIVIFGCHLKKLETVF